jgi:hypothetical protein
VYTRAYQLGDEVPILLLCRNGDDPAYPDAAPRATVYDEDGDAIADFYLPVIDKAEVAGLFLGYVYLGAEYAAGVYTVVSRWQVGLFNGLDAMRFEIVAGGGESGQVIAMHSYERPQSDFIVQQRTSGRLYKGRNPRV